MKRKAAPCGVPPPAVTPEQRYHMINDAAYFRALRHQHESGRSGDDAEAWCEVEAEIDDILKKHHAE